MPKKAPKMWISAPAKSAKPTIPAAEKAQTESACVSLLAKMKPRWIQPPNENFGYVSDIYGKWYRNYYYFCSLYRYDSPNAMRPEAEFKFVRLEYVGPGHFHMAYFRHTGQWFEVFENLSLEACLKEVETNAVFWP